MSDELEQSVRETIAENQRRRTDWSDLLGEVTSSLANGEPVPEHVWEVLDGGDGGSEDG